jgi:hypothetical protein
MHYFSQNCYLLQYFISASTLYMHPHVSGTERVGLSKQDACGNLVVKTPISVSGHETRFSVIPKLGKTWISMSGPETRSNGWIFSFPSFAEGVCCERPLDVIIILTDGHTTVRFFFRVVIICVLVLVQIDLIHFEHTKCISSTSIKSNTYLLHLRSIHTISCKIGTVLQIVPETPISVSGHETRFTAIPKLGQTWISVSGPETRSNGWIFPFPPFAEGVCCERPLDVIIILTDGHTTVRFFFRS